MQARDVDVTSDIRYWMIEPADSQFWVDPTTGKISVRPDVGGVEAPEHSNKIILTVLVSILYSFIKVKNVFAILGI